MNPSNDNWYGEHTVRSAGKKSLPRLKTYAIWVFYNQEVSVIAKCENALDFTNPNSYWLLELVFRWFPYFHFRVISFINIFQNKGNQCSILMILYIPLYKVGSLECHRHHNLRYNKPSKELHSQGGQRGQIYLGGYKLATSGHDPYNKRSDCTRLLVGTEVLNDRSRCITPQVCWLQLRDLHNENKRMIRDASSTIKSCTHLRHDCPSQLGSTVLYCQSLTWP